MQFTANKTALAKALQAVSRIVESRNTIPILSNILLSAAGKSLSLKATDLDLEASLTIEAEVHVAGDITVGGKLFADIARKMAGDQITFKATDVSATVTSGRSKFNLQTLPAADYPDLTAGAFTHTFEMASADLRRMFKHVSFAISTEETRYYLNGVYLHTTGANKIRAVATDGHRLARIELDAPDGSAGMPGIIVPRKTVGEIDKILEYGETVTVSLSEHKLRFDVGNAVLTSKAIDGNFPDYDRVIPMLNNKKVLASKLEFSKAVDRVSTVSTARGRAVKMTFEMGKVTLHVSNPDMGDATEEVSVDYEADDVSIGFNAQYVHDILNSIETDDVEIFLDEAGSPARFQPVGDSSLILVAMPMRV